MSERGTLQARERAEFQHVGNEGEKPTHMKLGGDRENSERQGSAMDSLGRVGGCTLSLLLKTG